MPENELPKTSVSPIWGFTDIAERNIILAIMVLLLSGIAAVSKVAFQKDGEARACEKELQECEREKTQMMERLKNDQLQLFQAVRDLENRQASAEKQISNTKSTVKKLKEKQQ